jgi:TonB family protein
MFGSEGCSTGGGSLLDKNGRLAAVVDDAYVHLPPYPETERKAGVAGSMILSISLGPDGYVKEIHAAKSLSPTLDEAAIDAVRSWRFKKVEGNPENSLEDLRLRFDFRATCWTAPKPLDCITMSAPRPE